MHHFPTRAELVEAVIDEIVARNERAVDTVAAEADDDSDPVGRAVRVLHVALSEPAFGAELELWTAARTDGELRAALRRAEHRAERDLDRVVAALFGPALAAHPRYPVVAELTTALLRGLLVAGPLRGGAGRSDQLLVEWAAVIHQMLDRH